MWTLKPCNLIIIIEYIALDAGDKELLKDYCMCKTIDRVRLMAPCKDNFVTHPTRE